MITSAQQKEVEWQVMRFNSLLDKFAPKDKTAFQVNWELNEYDDEPKYGLIAKLGDKVLYQFEDDNKEIVEALQRKLT